jgi:hypothetical protein
LSYCGQERYITDRVFAFDAIIHKLDDVPMRLKASRLVGRLIELNEAGYREVPAWAQKKIRAFDPLLCWRFDFERNQFALDRFDAERKIFCTISYWTDRLTEGDVYDAICLCRKGDMQKADSPEDYIRQKDAEAAKIEKANSDRATDKVLGVVDSLTDRQIEQFVKTEQAMHTGERIRPYSNDAVTLERMEKSGAEIPAPPLKPNNLKNRRRTQK